MLDYSNFSKQTIRLIESEIFIWLTTTSRDLTPQPRPVWFLWIEDKFLIYSRPNTFKIQHINERPKVSLHFNSDESADTDVAIFRGVANIVQNPIPLADIPSYVEKYTQGIGELDMSISEFNEAYSVAIRVQIQSLKEF